MLSIYNKTSYIYPKKILQKITSFLSDKEVELIITVNNDMQIYNLKYRNINKPTDVLSFPMEDMPLAPLGSIIISYDFIKEKSLEYKHSEDDEMCLLFIHGMLHLLGYDHEVDDGEMREKEKEIIQNFSLPDSLIIRNK
jgi:probable rRNA maturation factor